MSTSYTYYGYIYVYVYTLVECSVENRYSEMFVIYWNNLYKNIFNTRL